MRKKNIEDKKIVNIFSNQKGMALLTTLIFVFILVTFAVTLLTMTSNDTKLSSLQRESTRAFYLAETGIDKALWYLNTPVDLGGKDKYNWRPGNSESDPDPFKEEITSLEYYEISIKNIGISLGFDDDTDRIEITSVGTVKEGKYSAGKRTVVVTAKIGISPSSNLSYNYAIFADLILTLIGNLTVNGNVHANGNIDGSANEPTVNGTQTIGGDEDYPRVDFDWYKEMIEGDEIEGFYYGDNTSKIFNVSETISGIHFVDGDVEIPANVKLNISDGAILATGEFKSSGNAEIIHTRSENYTNPLALVSMGNMDLGGNISAQGIIQSNQDIVVGGTVDIVGGALFANNVRVNGDVVITYDPDLLGEVVIGTGIEVYIKTSWREAY